MLRLHVAVAPALSPNPEPDPLFILAGGPGQGASDTAPVLMPLLERIRRDRDVVFVDQRGTGKSHPLQCELEDPQADLGTRLLAQFDPERVRACAAELSKTSDLRRYTTLSAVEDLDEVRAALGYPRVNLWGGSYGTRVALAYMRRFPERVRTAALDGVAPLQLLLPLDAAEDAERALGLLFDHCGKDPACSSRYPALGERFAQLLGRLEAQPARTLLPHPLTGEPVELEIRRDGLAGLVRTLLYQAEATTLLPFTVDRALGGDFRPLAAQAELVSASLEGMLSVGLFFSVLCSEDVPFIPPDRLARAGEGTFLGGRVVRELVEACQLWPSEPVAPDFRQPVYSELPVLMLSGELDPITPPHWAELAGQTLPKAVHVTLAGHGHGTMVHACARRLVERFVRAGTADGLELRCHGGSDRPPFFINYAGPVP
jgi:pimeloyl-ACP methyl ester carboxylesterase